MDIFFTAQWYNTVGWETGKEAQQTLYIPAYNWSIRLAEYGLRFSEKVHSICESETGFKFGETCHMI